MNYTNGLVFVLAIGASYALCAFLIYTTRVARLVWNTKRSAYQGIAIIGVMLFLLGALIGCGPLKGKDGSNGQNGAAGTNGTDGANGQDGQNGTDGKDADPVTYIPLCPSIPGNGFNEYLLKISGEYFGVYSSGSNIFLVKLIPSAYVTTDGRGCNFTVNADGSIS